MALDVYFRDDIASILDALKAARGDGRGVDGLASEQIIAVKEYYEAGRCRGWHEALECVATAFRIHRESPATTDRAPLRLASSLRGDSAEPSEDFLEIERVETLY